MIFLIGQKGIVSLKWGIAQSYRYYIFRFYYYIFTANIIGTKEADIMNGTREDSPIRAKPPMRCRVEHHSGGFLRLVIGEIKRMKVLIVPGYR